LWELAVFEAALSDLFLEMGAAGDFGDEGPELLFLLLHS